MKPCILFFQELHVDLLNLGSNTKTAEDEEQLLNLNSPLPSSSSKNNVPDGGGDLFQDLFQPFNGAPPASGLIGG